MARSTAPARPPPASPPPSASCATSGWRRGRSRRSCAPTSSTGWPPAGPSFPGIVGYEETVIPAIENAILAGQDIVFLGERGQAKTRLARLLVDLLDEWLPVVRGGELNDDPFAPISAAARAIVAEGGDETPIDWIPRDRRYAEKLATPDITIADLIGEVDPIRVAEGRYLSDELTLHYGLIPRANRGIFALNELPDLAERIQVGLLNILEERDVQVRGFTIRLPLDLFVVASANPEDYTSRGRIITPLKDRLGSQVRTHYPRSLEHEVAIVRQEKQAFPARDGDPAGRGARVHGGAGRRADPPRPALAGDQPAERRVGPRLGRQHGGPRGRRDQARGPARRARRGAPGQRPRRGARDDDRQGRGRDRGRGHARGADRRAARDQGGVRDVQPARVGGPAGAGARGVRGRPGRRDRRPRPGARLRPRDARGPRAARLRRAAGPVRCRRRRRGARAGRVRGRAAARGPAPPPPAQQGPRPAGVAYRR